MNDPDFSWLPSKRYNSYSAYFKRTFGGRVQKVTIDAGFTCPNRDGTKGRGGCTYCNNDAFNPSYCKPQKRITQQIVEGIEFHKVRYRRADKFLAYFQAFSNTYAPVEQLSEMYREALSYPGVSGLVIGTRPDCIDDAKLSLLKELSANRYIMVEYGIESCYDTSLKRINRGHTFTEAEKAIRLTHQYGIHTGAHIIFGLPGETRMQMLDEAEILSALPLDSIKFHQLQIIKGTVMEKDFKLHPEDYQLFTLDEYIDFVVSFAEKLHPGIVIERFTSEAPPRFQAGPVWGNLRADEVQRLIENCFEARNTWQGKFFATHS